jgi:hypothetical protein
MTPISRILIALLACAACRGEQSNSGSAPEQASSSQSAPTNPPDSTSSTGSPPTAISGEQADIQFREPPDSNDRMWTFPDMNNGNERFTGMHVRHPSGLMVIWFDTATRATEDTPAGTTHVDSVVVSGLKHGEYLTFYCNADGRHETWKSQIVGILRDTTNYLRPRMAWILDTVSYKIRAIPTDKVLCSAADLFGEGDDD